MAYTHYSATAFPSGEGHEEGWDYVPAQELIDRILQVNAKGKAYISEDGNFVYEVED